MSRRTLAPIVCVLALLVVAIAPMVVAAEATLLVPAQYATIQAAVDAASPGDVIVVAEGTYNENIVIQGKGVTIRSSNPGNPATVAATIIDGGGVEYGIFIEDAQGVTIEGLTIRNGATAGGAAIRVFRSTITIRNNVLCNNTAKNHGGAIHSNNSKGSIIGNEVYDNTAGGRGGAIFLHQSGFVIQNNIVRDNTSGSGGGGLFISLSPETVVLDNTISGNSASKGGGIIVGNNTIVVAGNTITDNVGAESGGGIDIWDTGAVLNLQGETWPRVSCHEPTNRYANNQPQDVHFDDVGPADFCQ